MRAWIVTLLSLWPLYSHAEEFLGRVVKVDAGNRLEVMYNGRPEHIRLYGVACPAGEASAASRQYLQRLTEARAVYVRPIRPDGSGSRLAWVKFIGGHNLSEEVVREGYGRWDPAQAPKYGRLKWLESQARRARRGLWVTKEAFQVPPRKETRRSLSSSSQTRRPLVQTH